jgi:carboxymethylenebutenolidase
MCFDHDSRPPIPPIAGGALDSREITLTASDGNRLSAFEARAAQPTGAAIVILPDVRGLHDYYLELALRFAERGVDAVAFDWFGRTAGLGRRQEGFDYMPEVQQLTWDGMAADITAAAGQARTFNPTRLFTVGFCMGGRAAFLTPTLGLGLSGAIGFYGSPVGAGRGGSPQPVDVADQMEGTVLGLFGGAD